MSTEFRIELHADGWAERSAVDLSAAVTAESGDERHDGTIRINVRVTDEGMILDSYDAEGNVAGTVADDWDGWDQRIIDDPAQKPLWEDDLVQFARLLDEIRATQDGLRYGPLRESMDLDDDGITEIFERAQVVFEASKDKLGSSWLDGPAAGR